MFGRGRGLILLRRVWWFLTVSKEKREFRGFLLMILINFLRETVESLSDLLWSLCKVANYGNGCNLAILAVYEWKCCIWLAVPEEPVSIFDLLFLCNRMCACHITFFGIMFCKKQAGCASAVSMDCMVLTLRSGGTYKFLMMNLVCSVFYKWSS